MGRERLADAGLGAAALVVVLLTAGALEVRGHTLPLAAGVGGALVAEFALQRRRAAVRRAWARPVTKAATIGAFLAALALSLAVAPTTGLSLLAGGLVGYLALLTGVAVGRSLTT